MTVSEKLRLVQGLHSHAEMFGFNWDDCSDWTWHDVVCKIADEIDAENAKLREDNDLLIQAIEDLHNVSLEDELVRLENENAKLRELVRGLHMAYVGALNECESMDSGLISGITARWSMPSLPSRMRDSRPIVTASMQL